MDRCQLRRMRRTHLQGYVNSDGKTRAVLFVSAGRGSVGAALRRYDRIERRADARVVARGGLVFDVPRGTRTAGNGRP